MNTGYSLNTPQMLKPTNEIEADTAECWLAAGTINVESYGSENTYYVDQFDIEYYSKNYPQHWS